MSNKPPINMISWICPRCGGHFSTALGCKWVLIKGLKRRICANCAKERADKAAAKAASVVTAPEQVEDLTCTTRHDLPPIPKGFPAPFKLWHHE